MVSYYTPVAMFGRTGTGHHHHHHHSSTTQNPYFSPAAAYSANYHHPAAHHHHQSPTAAPAVSATQFSPTMTTDFNSNHQYQHHFGNMSTDPMAAAAAASWAQPAMYSACAARNIVSTCGYDNWHDPHPPPPLPPPSASQTHPFYHHHNLHHHQQQQQPSPSSSTPSPTSPSGHQSPNSIYTTSTNFKTEFGPCSGGNSQESASQEMQSGSVVVSSAGSNSAGNNASNNNNNNNMVTPHSPDSGMAISDGVSSSGSPANGGGNNNNGQHCLGGGGGGNHHINSSMNPSILGSQQTNLNQQQSIHSRPTQVRSPYEWMKKPSYSVSCNSNGKTRTKDKYRVVYSDTQRVELEKEFHYSRYITIRRKAELASILGLSERQVKIWFQNRRAKERKMVRKQEEILTREKIATMVHMQNAAVAAAGGMSQISNAVMCNQGNGNSLSLM